MSKAELDAETILKHATPVTQQKGRELQPFGHLVRMPIALPESACKESVENLNQLLADTMTLRDIRRPEKGISPHSNTRSCRSRGRPVHLRDRAVRARQAARGPGQ